MYLNHFNLKLKPFQISADPKFVWLGEKHKEALAMLKYGILQNIGFLLLTGDVGTGKTTIINCLLKEIGNQAYVATVFDPALEPLEFFNFISAEFNLNQTFDTKGAFLTAFKKYLLSAYHQNKKVLLIIDESQRLLPETMEQIRLLSNIEMPHSKLINIFFVGQTEFSVALSEDKNRAIRQRINVQYNLDPLTESEVNRFIEHRLKVAGSNGHIFTHEAVGEIYSFSHGYPRLINIICDNALLTGYVKDLQQIDAALIRQCARDFQASCGLDKRSNSEAEIDETEKFSKIKIENKKSQNNKYFIYLILFVILGGLVLLSFSNLDLISLITSRI